MRRALCSAGAFGGCDWCHPEAQGWCLCEVWAPYVCLVPLLQLLSNNTYVFHLELLSLLYSIWEWALCTLGLPPVHMLHSVFLCLPNSLSIYTSLINNSCTEWCILVYAYWVPNMNNVIIWLYRNMAQGRRQLPPTSSRGCQWQCS